MCIAEGDNSPHRRRSEEEPPAYLFTHDDPERYQMNKEIDLEKRKKAMDGISRSIQRLRSIIEQDFPPVLATGELDLLEQHLATLRRS